MRVQGNLPREDIIKRVRELGYNVVEQQAEGENQAAAPRPASFLAFMWGRWDTRLALLAALLVLPGLVFHELLPNLGLHHPLIDFASVLAMVLAGYPVAQSAVRALWFNRSITINALMSIAAIGAVIIGAYTEAGVVMVFFVIGEALEGYTTDKARNSIRTLVEMTPKDALRIEDGQETVVAIADLRVDDIILVKPGQRIPMDGRVRAGRSFVNQAPITGESKLISKQPGDEVFASSINGESVLEIQVTNTAEDNTIARLIRMVEEAQENRAPVQRFVDRFAEVYTPAVVVMAFLVATIPPLFFGQPFWGFEGANPGWLYRGLALLVVACPCALVISTPVSLISAISNGARNGVLFKGGAYLEAFSRVQAIAFDKTGTLTEGKPAVVDVRSIACAEDVERCENCDDLVALAHAVERRSEHPLAQAVIAEAKHRGLGEQYSPARRVTALTGRGVLGEVEGQDVLIGSHEYFDENIPHGDHCQAVTLADGEGRTTMLILRGDAYAGYIAVSDKVRPTSAKVLSALQVQGVESLVMLTGDNASAAQSIAAGLPLTEVRANCLPEDKVAAVQELREKYDSVAMVGDGINDTPALATASVGIAIGSSAQAMETADISLMGDDLTGLPFALGLSRATMRNIRTNVGLSIGIKALFLLALMFGLGSMWLAVLADVGVSVLVTLNGMRLLKWADKKNPFNS